MERNRRLGRPGSKGRGGGDRGATSSGRGGGRVVAEARHNPASNLGSNEWRYHEEADGARVDDDVDGMLASSSGYVEHGPAHDDIASTLLGGDDGSYNGDGENGVSHINLDDLARSLRKIPTHELLDMPLHIAREYDKKYGEFVDEKRAKTISELRVAGTNSNSIKTTLGSNTDAKPLTAGSPVTTNKAAQSGEKPNEAVDITETSPPSKDGGDGGEDAEDLDAWLDSVI